MDRTEVYKVIDSERDFQNNGKENDDSHIVEDFPLGSALSAIQYKLDLTRQMWYNDTTPHKEAMGEIRKIAAICVQMGEQFGMKPRD